VVDRYPADKTITTASFRMRHSDLRREIRTIAHQTAILGRPDAIGGTTRQTAHHQTRPPPQTAHHQARPRTPGRAAAADRTSPGRAAYGHSRSVRIEPPGMTGMTF